MKVIHNKVVGNTVITEDTRFHGTYEGQVTVKENKTLVLHGMIVGSLYLEDRSDVKVHGTVSKDIINQGGNLEIFGTVNGRIFNNSGTIFIDPNAKVGSVIK